MSLPQTSVGEPDSAIEGLLADDGRKSILTRINGEASAEIAFGRAVKVGAVDDEVLLPAATTDRLFGVSVYGSAYAKGVPGTTLEIGDTGVKPEVLFDVLTRGRIYVRAEDVVTPSSEVHVRMAAGQGGAALVVADFTFTGSASADTATKVAHGLLTGDGPIRVANSGGALPTGISAATDYWVIKVDADTFKFATTRANALAGTAINLTSDGTGTQTLSDTASTERVVTAVAGGFRGTADGSPLVVADLTFVGEADDDTATASAHGLLTGDGPIRVANSGGALPTGLAAATDYWVIKVTANTFKFATSRANALAGTAINLTADGSGTQTLSDTADTERVNTVNVSKFCRWRTSSEHGLPGDIAELDVDFRHASLATLG